MKEELVSVIIACYNGEKYIDECLNSIVNQSYKNIEIIICDDASLDKSFLMLKKWEFKEPRIIVLKNKRNLFSAASRNACIDIAKGEFLLIHDIDDISRPNRIDVLLKNLIEQDVDFVSSSMSTIDEDGNINNKKLLKHKKRPNKYDFLWNLPFNHPATLFLTKSVKEINGYRVAKSTRRGQDYDMFMRLYANGSLGINIIEPLYSYRVNNANLKRRTLSARIDECIIRFNGYKKLNILYIGFPMIFKPIAVHFIKNVINLFNNKKL